MWKQHLFVLERNVSWGPTACSQVWEDALCSRHCTKILTLWEVIVIFWELGILCSSFPGGFRCRACLPGSRNYLCLFSFIIQMIKIKSTHQISSPLLSFFWVWASKVVNARSIHECGRVSRNSGLWAALKRMTRECGQSHGRTLFFWLFKWSF